VPLAKVGVGEFEEAVLKAWMDRALFGLEGK